jgi:hypothetical protein
LIYDPRKGDSIREHLSLQGNPAVTEDWWTNPKTGKVVDFIDFARSEGRFGKHFDKEGNPSETLMRAREDRLENWHLLQDLAGLRGGTKAAKAPPAKPEPRAAAQPMPKSNGKFAAGARIKYHDGHAWIPGTVESLEPAILKLDDGSAIHTSHDVFLAGVAAGLISNE